MFYHRSHPRSQKFIPIQFYAKTLQLLPACTPLGDFRPQTPNLPPLDMLTSIPLWSLGC